MSFPERGLGRVLLTGASGFIGRQLLDRLTENGEDVTAVCRTPPDDVSGDATWIAGNLEDLSFVEELFASYRPLIVFHLAGHVTGSRELDAVLPTFRSNLEATINVMTLAARTEADRVILAGSLEEPDPDNTPAVPCSPYAASKWAASGYARMFHRLYGLPVTTARIFMVYGPGPQDIDKLAPYTIRTCLANRPPEIRSADRPVDWVYIEDVVDGLLTMAATDRDLGGKTVELGSGRLTPIREVVTEIVRLTGCSADPDFGSASPRAFERLARASPEETAEQIGWHPETSLEEGLRRTVEWFRERHDDGDRARGPR